MGCQGFPYVDSDIGWSVGGLQTRGTRSPDLIKVGEENVPFKVYYTSFWIFEAKDPVHMSVCMCVCVCGWVW